MTERRMTEWQTAVNIDYCSILKNKKQPYPLNVFPKVWLKQHINVQKKSKRGRKELPINKGEKNADRIYAEMV